MEYTSPALGYCFNPFEFCVEGDKFEQAELAVSTLSEMLAEDYRVAVVQLRQNLPSNFQRHDFPVLTVEMPLDHHPLRRPMRLLDADLVIVCSPAPTPLPRVSVSADMDQTIAGVIACINDPGKTATLRRSAKRISHWLEKTAAGVPVYGLVVDEQAESGKSAGAASTAVETAAALLSGCCEKVFLADPASATGREAGSVPSLPDLFPGTGVLGAILTAQKHHPRVAWMVLSSRYCGLDKQALEYLRDHRNPFRYATAFKVGPQMRAEPLCGIWEPKSHRRLLEAMGCGVDCVVQLLEGSPSTLLQLPGNPA
jgi:molybdopterin-guanine dinucleotide biosynthesis protein A